MLATQAANDGLWDWNLADNKIYYSPRWKTMLGCSEEQVKDCPDEWFNRVNPADLSQVKLALSKHLQGLTPYFESEHRMQHEDGSYRWVLARGLAVRSGNGSANGAEHSATRLAGSLSDITARKVAEEQLLHDALHDALTGLPNRALFLDRLGRAIERTHRHPSHFAVCTWTWTVSGDQ
jgi:PAS domain S-box-containing protein